MNHMPPSILAYLNEVTDPLLHRYRSGEPNLWFTKPSPGNGVEILHGESPMEQLRIVKLSLHGRGCIPFHRHHSKEKVYYVLPQDKHFIAYLGVLDPETGVMTVNQLVPGQTFVVPKKHWHTIWVTSGEQINDCLLVVSSSQDGSDVEWTPEGDLLVHLTEKSNKDCQGETPLQLPFSELIVKINEALEDS